MGFYDLEKGQRDDLVRQIAGDIANAIDTNQLQEILLFFGHKETYIRKAAYLALGKLYNQNKDLQAATLSALLIFMADGEPRVRQTAVNAAGEIGKLDFGIVQHFFDTGLFDVHHSVRNAVIGSMKKMGEVNPEPVLLWARKYLHHPDKEIRREICHGVELRGRKHPEDILPLLRQLQYDTTKRVRWTLVHVIGQISYKQGCLEKVVADLLTWENHSLVADALAEIMDVHHRYRTFAYYTQTHARQYIQDKAPGIITT